MVWPEDACINSVVHSINKLFTILCLRCFKFWTNVAGMEFAKPLLRLLKSFFDKHTILRDISQFFIVIFAVLNVKKFTSY